MGGCQNYGPFLGTLNMRCRIIVGTPKGTIILTTTHTYRVDIGLYIYIYIEELYRGLLGFYWDEWKRKLNYYTGSRV